MFKKINKFKLACLKIFQVLLLISLFAVTAADAAYTQVYSTIQKGALTFTGNTLVLNSPTVSGAGGAYISVGSGTTAAAGYPVDTTTNYLLNKSRAELNIPVGATVLYAELIWSGSVGTNTAAVQNSSVTFETPRGTYTIAPSAATASSNGTYYTRSANVTGLVQIGGGGTYTTGGVPGMAASGTTDGAGWTLAVAYADPSKVARNLTIFVGQELSGAAPAIVSGFCTPLSGAVNGRALVSAIEGDTTGVGDRFLFGPSSTLTAAANSLSGPNNAIGNFFASQINGDTGTIDSTGSFGTSNQIINIATNAGTNVNYARQGYDISNVDVSAFLVNSQTTASAQGTTSNDVYGINAIGLQINVTSPVFPVSVKSVNKSSTFVGDTLRYSIVLDNTAGNGAANNTNLFDTLPAGMVLVPNSVLVNGVIQTGADPANGISIGNVPAGGIVTVVFDATVIQLPASPAPAKFDNSASWNYTYIACAGVVAQPGSVTTSPVTVTAARLAPTKSVSPTGPLVGGQTATYTITVPNTGLLNTAGTTLADPIPAGTVYVAGSTKLNGIAVPDATGSTMPFTAAGLVNSAGQAPGVIAFGAAATIQFSVAATTGGVILNTATIDPDGAGPGTPITVSAVNSGLVGPSVTKSFVPATIGAGGKSVATVKLINPNNTAITGVTMTDNLPAGLTVANPANAGTTCGVGAATATPSGSTLVLIGGSIPANSSCTITADVTAVSAGLYTNTIPVGAVTSSNAGLNTAGSQSLTVNPAPSISKSFAPSTVAQNTSSTLSITLSNPTSLALTSATFTDIFPSIADGSPGNMILFDAVVTNGCGGTLTDAAGATLAAGSTGIKLVGGTIAATNVCTITVHVKASVGGSYGNVIPVGSLLTSGGTNTASANATLQIASPQVQKSFAATTVGANIATVMTITLTNVTGITITSLAFNDTYPAGLVNANTTTTNTCGGTAIASAIATNPGTLVLSGATTLPAGASCTITANVQSATSGSYTNSILAGAVTSSIGPNAAGASATLNVARPTISKAFLVPTIPLNGSTTLTITLNNPTSTAMTGAAFSDALPTGLIAAAAAGTCVGTKSPAGTIVSITAGTIPANGSCTVTALVTGIAVGLKTNTIPVGGLTVSGPAIASSGTPAVADVTVLGPPSISKSFISSPILPNTASSVLRIVLSNSNSVALTAASFVDTFPTAPGAMTLFDTVVSNSCAGTVLSNLSTALVVGSAGIRLNGGTIPSNGSCIIQVNVKAAAAGDYTNTIAAGALTTLEGGANTVATTSFLAVRLAAPTVTKSFASSSIVANTPTILTLTINNSSTTQAITGASWSDIFPAGMKVIAPAGFSNSCGGTVTAGNTANDTSITINNATVPFTAAGTGTCSISVSVTSTVTAASPGLINTTGTVTSTNANTSGTATANLIVTSPPLSAVTIAKTFLQPSISSGGISTIRFTLDSTNTGILTNANFTDTLTNMSVASATIGGTCASVTNLPALIVGATGANALNLTVPNVAPGGCTVEIQVTSTTLGLNPNSVSAVTTTQISGGAGSGPVNLTVVISVPPALTVSKTVSQSPLVVGASGQFYSISINVANGPTTAAISVADSLPAGITTSGPVLVNGAATVGCAVATGASTLAGCTIPTNTTGPIVITVPVSVAATATTGTNTVTVAGGGDPLCSGTAPACTTATAATLILDAISETITTAPLTTGTTNVASNDIYPVGSVYTQTATTCTPAGSITSAGIVSYTSPAASSSCSVTYTVCAPSAFTVCDNAILTISSGLAPVLTVSKTVSQNPLVVGASGQFYTITIAVSGAATTAPITLADTLPTGITTSGAITATGGALSGCPSAGALNINTCVIATGAAVGNIVITVPVSVAATATSGTNTARVSGGGDSTCTVGAPCAGSVTATISAAPPQVATVTLAKTWSGASVNDAVSVTATGLTSLASIANTANETDTGVAQTVAVGSILSLGESFTTGVPANYSSSLACTGTSGLNASTGVLTVGSLDTSIVCTYSNTKKTATVTLAKTWSGASINDAVSVTATGLTPLASIANTANETDTGAAQTVAVGSILSLGESFTTGVPANTAAA